MSSTNNPSAAAGATPSPGAVGATQVHTQPVGLPELPPRQPVGPALMGAHAGLLDSVTVSLSVLVGDAHITLGELMSLKEAAVLKIDRLVDAPVDVVINGNVVARGQLVVVDEHFGVRVTEIAASAA